MSVEKGENFLGDDPSPEQAFSWAKKLYNVDVPLEVLETAPVEFLDPVARFFFTAGLAYLSNRAPHPILQDIGTDAWTAIDNFFAVFQFAMSMEEQARSMGFPEATCQKLNGRTVPEVIFGHRGEKPEVHEMGVVFIPLEFLVTASTNPIEALAELVYVCSQLRDLIHGQKNGNDRMHLMRAKAARAHFLNCVVDEFTDVELSQQSQEVMRYFPNGFLDIPEGFLYRGTVVRTRDVNDN